MYGRPSESPQWSVHAEFTISHNGADENNPPDARVEREGSGVRMTYRWTSQTPSDAWATHSNHPVKKPATGKPVIPLQRTARVQDSGYSSELHSQGSSTLPHPQPYNRKCRSSCSIVLSTAINEEVSSDASQQCGRTQSLRCQTPRSETSETKFYGCGDPWCYHSSELPSEDKSSASTFSTVRAKSSTPPQRDVSVQTLEMVDKSTSPYMRSESFKYKAEDGKRVARKRSGKSKVERQSSYTPDSLESQKSSRRLMRSPQLLPEKSDSTIDTSKSSDQKKPRTVHIDVYCTGTEMDSDASTSSSKSDKTNSTPQTVYESRKMRITHKRANTTELPIIMKDTPKNLGLPSKIPSSSELQKQTTTEDKDDSDIDDGASTAYPSQLSSYSAIRDFASSFSSVPPSWSTVSMSSSYPIPEDYDSVANTSWKDTYSDLGSLMQSRSSIAPTDSLDFIPRKLSNINTKTPSIDETPETDVKKDLLDTPSVASVHGSDSFEYANSEDKLRIRQMEKMLKGQTPIKPWKSPHLERKHMLQQQRLIEYLDRRMSSEKGMTRAEKKESESEESDSSVKGWTFVGREDTKKLQRGGTIRRASKEDVQRQPPVKQPAEDPGSLSDSSPASKSPSAIALRQRLILDPNLRAPFSIVPGVYTDPRIIAQKFGTIVPVMKKPGHHIGPAKNPDCLCEHCKHYFERFGVNRGRARSVGDAPIYQNWKQRFRPQDSTESASKEQKYTDF